jgi:hypothetical protein
VARIARLKSAVIRPRNLIAAIVALYAALWVGAALPNVWALVVGLVGALAVEKTSRRVIRRAIALLNQVQLGATPRWLIRNSALVVFAAREHLYSTAAFLIVTLGLLASYGGYAAFLNLRTMIDRWRRMQTPTLNIDVSALRIPDAPPPNVIRAGSNLPLLITAAVAVGVLIDKFAGIEWAGLAGLAIGLAGAALVGAAMVRLALQCRHLGNQARVTKVIREQLQQHAPQVALYYAGGADTAYQVNMWLETIASLSLPSLIMCRDRAQMASIGRTNVPVLCLSGNSEVMDFELPSLKVVLYTGNTGKNFNMLRDPDLKHVFIGHGDSDKVASANPVSKVYDEVWVAGRAGRDRYRRARVGVRDEAIVEVGRPQLHTISAAAADRPMFTVIYAPTWEGWTNDNLVSSLHVLGVKLIKNLLERSPEVRVIYKPHPMTGLRNPQVKKAHEQIVAMIAAANRKRRAQAGWAKIATETEAARKSAGAKKAQLAAKAGKLSAALGKDAATMARNSGAVSAAAHAELDRIALQTEDAFWATTTWWTHQVVTGKTPSLYSCFNESDAMISDISSVVSDFVASGKPYVVTNLHDVSEAQFRHDQTAAGGAYLLGSDCAELQDILAAVQSGAPDVMATQRDDARTYLLGPSEPDSMTRFNDAVLDLAARRDADVAARHASQLRIDTVIPTQTEHAGVTSPQISAITR